MSNTRSHDIITTNEAASKIGCTIQHVRLLIRQGLLKGTKRGRDWFVENRSVDGLVTKKLEDKKTARRGDRHVQQTLPMDVPAATKLVNVSSVPQRSPFRYPGGKTWLIPIAREWLTALGSEERTLIEPFAGGGGIGLMAAFEKRVIQAHLVELDPDIAVVWRAMLSDSTKALQKRILGFDCTPEEVRKALDKSERTEAGKAFQTVVRNRVSRGGILAPGAGFTKEGEAGKGIASRWYPETLVDRLAAIYEHRDRLRFTEGDGLTVLCENADDENAVFFIDPPYPVAGRRLYRFHDLDHRRLFSTMRRLRGPFLATYDHNPDIEAMAKEFGFDTRLTPMKSTHHTKKFELLISRDLSWFSGHVSVSSASLPASDGCGARTQEGSLAFQP